MISSNIKEQPSTDTVEKKVEFVDRSELLLSQMTFIAMNNKSFIKFKK